MGFGWPSDRNSEIEISDGARVIWRRRTSKPRTIGKRIVLRAQAKGWDLQSTSQPRDLRDDVQLIEYILVKTVGGEVQRRFVEVIYPVSPLTWTGAL
jgi:hypothetical protein